MIKIALFCGGVSGFLSGSSLLISCSEASVSCSLINSHGAFGVIVSFLVGAILGGGPGFLYSIWTIILINLFKKIYDNYIMISFLTSTLTYVSVLYFYHLSMPAGLLLSVDISIYTAGLLTFYKCFRAKNMS